MGNCNGLFSKCADENGLQKVDQYTIKAAVEANERAKKLGNNSNNHSVYVASQNYKWGKKNMYFGNLTFRNDSTNRSAHFVS
jgi:hypothetical protein